MWFIRQEGSAAPVSYLSTTVEKLPSFNECSEDNSEHDPSVSSGVTISAQNEEFNVSPDWHLFFCMEFHQRVWSVLHWGGDRDVVCRTATANTETVSQSTRTEKSSAIELSVLKLGSRDVVLTAGRDVCLERLCVWPILGDRWIMTSRDGALVDGLCSHLVALRDIIGKQTYPREAQQFDQFELAVSDDDFRDWVRQGQQAAVVISSRENLLASIFQPDSGFYWEC